MGKSLSKGEAARIAVLKAEAEAEKAYQELLKVEDARLCTQREHYQRVHELQVQLAKEQLQAQMVSLDRRAQLCMDRLRRNEEFIRESEKKDAPIADVMEAIQANMRKRDWKNILNLKKFVEQAKAKKKGKKKAV